MGKYLLKRLGSGLALVVFIATLTFLLIEVAGGDPVRNFMGQNVTAEQVEIRRAELGLDRPVGTRYLDWMGSAAQGDFGRSWRTNQSVTEAIVVRLPVTLSLVIVSLVLSATASIVLGVAAAVRRGWLDRMTQVLAVVGLALPSFWVGLVLVTYLGVQLGWFPATGYVRLSTDPGRWLWSIALPSVALGMGAIASTSQQIRGAMIDVLRQDFIRTLRSRGLSERRILLRHGLRNAAPPALTVLSLQFIGLLGGAVAVERVFALPGLGTLMIHATVQRDTPQILGVVTMTVLIVVLVNLVIDLAYGWLNPKVRL